MISVGEKIRYFFWLFGQSKQQPQRGSTQESTTSGTTKTEAIKKARVFAYLSGLINSGTSGRTRTDTPAKATDFESVMSTNSITLALSFIDIVRSALAINA